MASILETPRSEIGLALLVFVISRLMHTVRFYVVCRAGLTFWQHMGLTMGSQAGIILLPFRAGELFRPFCMNRWNPQMKWSALLFWALFEKIIEAMTLLPLLAFVAFSFQDAANLGSVMWAYVGGVAMCLVAMIVFRRKIRSFMKVALEGRSWQRFLFWPVVTSVASWLAWWWLFYIFFPYPIPSLIMSVVVIVASSVPGLPAGLGAFEAAFVLVAQKWGWTFEAALAKALVLHALIIVFTLVWGTPYLVAWSFPERHKRTAH